MNKIKQFFKNLLAKIKSLFKRKEEDKDELIVVPPVIPSPPKVDNATVGTDKDGNLYFKK